MGGQYENNAEHKMQRVNSVHAVKSGCRDERDQYIRAKAYEVAIASLSEDEEEVDGREAS